MPGCARAKARPSPGRSQSRSRVAAGIQAASRRSGLSVTGNTSIRIMIVPVIVTV